MCSPEDQWVLLRDLREQQSSGTFCEFLFVQEFKSCFWWDQWRQRFFFGEAGRTCSEYSHKTKNNEFPCMAPRINLQMLLNSIRVHPELTFILSMVFHKCYCLVRILPLPLSDFQRNWCFSGLLKGIQLLHYYSGILSQWLLTRWICESFSGGKSTHNSVFSCWVRSCVVWILPVTLCSVHGNQQMLQKC